MTLPPPDSGWPATESLAFQLANKVVAAFEPNAGTSRVLVSTIARGQAAKQLASQAVERTLEVDLFEFEHYRYRLLVEATDANEITGGQAFLAKSASGISVICDARPNSDAKYACVVLSVRRDWGAELTRDLLQSFSQCLAENANFIVVVDHPDDSWVGDHLREAVKGNASESAKSVRRFVSENATETYGATGYIVNQAALKYRERDFGCQFAFRHNNKLLQAYSVPGVFAHRKLDLGARRLIDAMEIQAGQTVLDIGCGSGVVSFATASRSPEIQVTAIDSNTRAIECTLRGASLNGLESQIKAIVSSDGSVPNAGSYDVALGNPPYFANFQIAELFLKAAHDAVKPGGKIWFVAKQPDWYKLNVPRWFDRVRVSSVGGGYCIATGIRPQESRHDQLSKETGQSAE